MNTALLIVAVLAGLQSPPVGGATGSGAATEGRPDPPPPPPRKAIAGFEGFECVSTIVFPSSPERSNRLRSTYVFPDRARWQLTLLEEKHGDREVRYRYGEHAYLLRAGSHRSEECSGDERDEMLLSMELRRALVLYPDGFDWKDAGPERRADLVIGTLLALPASAGDSKPAEMRALARDGKVVEAFRSIVWREKNGRSWPSTLELWRANELLWRETIDSIDVEGRVIDAYFLPADRRPASGSAMPVEKARNQDLPASCGLRVEIPKGAAWTEVAQGYGRLREEWNVRLRDLGFDVDRHATVEIGPNGEAVAWVVRLDPIPDQPPSEFRKVGTRRGVVLAVRGLAGITAEKLGQLNAALPNGSKAGNAYVRFDSRDGDGATVLIVLPYSIGKGG